jgi:hypothetical protein
MQHAMVGIAAVLPRLLAMGAQTITYILAL